MKMTNKMRAAAAAVLALMLAAGCSTPAKESEPVVGSWKLDHVTAAEPGQELKEMDPESAASLYGEAENTYVFNEDGTTVLTVVDGPDSVDVKGTWTKSDGGYSYKDEQGIEQVFIYDSADDTIRYEWTSDDADSPYEKVVTVFARQK